jgi:hypothetical protein
MDEHYPKRIYQGQTERGAPWYYVYFEPNGYPYVEVGPESARGRDLVSRDIPAVQPPEVSE